jgi:hypothetical protein
MSEMLKAIAAARNHINLETYIFDQDELGLKFADALIEKQQQGVTVNILYDSVGTIGVPAEFFKRMRDAGIHLIEFNPVNPAKVGDDGWKLNNRDHRKMLIVDGKVGFTGGINISATYARVRCSAPPPADRQIAGRLARYPHQDRRAGGALVAMAVHAPVDLAGQGRIAGRRLLPAAGGGRRQGGARAGQRAGRRV